LCACAWLVSRSPLPSPPLVLCSALSRSCTARGAPPSRSWTATSGTPTQRSASARARRAATSSLAKYVLSVFVSFSAHARIAPRPAGAKGSCFDLFLLFRSQRTRASRRDQLARKVRVFAVQSKSIKHMFRSLTPPLFSPLFLSAGARRGGGRAEGAFCPLVMRWMPEALNCSAFSLLSLCAACSFCG
jgi:hypothetical protein